MVHCDTSMIAKNKDSRHPILEIALVQHLVCSLIHTFQSLNCRPPEQSGLVQNRSNLGSLQSSDWTMATLNERCVCDCNSKVRLLQSNDSQEEVSWLLVD
jgi:hypothetical protein